jgi:hypothetical protein
MVHGRNGLRLLHGASSSKRRIHSALPDAPALQAARKVRGSHPASPCRIDSDHPFLLAEGGRCPAHRERGGCSTRTDRPEAESVEAAGCPNPEAGAGRVLAVNYGASLQHDPSLFPTAAADGTVSGYAQVTTPLRLMASLRSSAMLLNRSFGPLDVRACRYMVNFTSVCTSRPALGLAGDTRCGNCGLFTFER